MVSAAAQRKLLFFVFFFFPRSKPTYLPISPATLNAARYGLKILAQKDEQHFHQSALMLSFSS